MIIYIVIGVMVTLGFYLSMAEEFEKDTRWEMFRNVLLGVFFWPMFITFLLIEIWKELDK